MPPSEPTSQYPCVGGAAAAAAAVVAEAVAEAAGASSVNVKAWVAAGADAVGRGEADRVGAAVARLGRPSNVAVVPPV